MTTARALAGDVRAGRRDAVEVVEEALAAAAADATGAFVHVDGDAALAEARGRAAALRRGDAVGPLHGVPVAVKDLVDVAGQVTRAGSRVPGRPATRDAPLVRRLREAGAVLLGRTRTHEFAWGITTQHETLGGTRNPHDPDRVPGGSSGGSGAAVAAGVVPLAVGTDTGCSIRLPAAWCGVVGVKPAHGAVPMAGVVPLAPSLDTGGPLAADVADAALALAVLTGAEVRPAGSVRGVRVGVVERTGLPVTADVAAAVDDAAARLAAAGAAVAPVRVDLAPTAEVYAVLQAVEALAVHRAAGWWPDRAADYGADVRARLTRAGTLTGDRVAAASAGRDALRRSVAALPVDVLLLPVAAGPAPPVGAPDVDVDGTAVALRDAVLPWTVLANLTGLPAASLPAGRDALGLPVGVQLVARDLPALLAVATAAQA